MSSLPERRSSSKKRVKILNEEDVKIFDKNDW